MTLTELVTLSPFIVLTAAAVVLMLAVAFYRHHLLTVVPDTGRACVGLHGAAGGVVHSIASGHTAPRARPLRCLLHRAAHRREFRRRVLRMGTWSDMTAIARILPPPRAGDIGFGGAGGEQPFRLLFPRIGNSECVSVHLDRYPRRSQGHIEAGIKYLILAAASAAFLLFGMALVYAELGTMEFARIASFQRTLARGAVPCCWRV